MGDWEALDAATKAVVRQVINQCRQTGKMASLPCGNDAEVYAYPHPEGGISWGVNNGPFGLLIARGIRS